MAPSSWDDCTTITTTGTTYSTTSSDEYDTTSGYYTSNWVDVRETEEYKENFCGRTVLITGGAGAIGSNLSRTLAELDAKTVIIVTVGCDEHVSVPAFDIFGMA